MVPDGAACPSLDSYRTFSPTHMARRMHLSTCVTHPIDAPIPQASHSDPNKRVISVSRGARRPHHHYPPSNPCVHNPCAVSFKPSE